MEPINFYITKQIYNKYLKIVTHSVSHLMNYLNEVAHIKQALMFRIEELA